MMPSPHPFARFVQILGRGKSLTRSLNVAEAQEAMGMILAGKVLPEQLGAFLMLLRVKEESPEEIAGFVLAARAAMALPSPLPQADLDWSSYAGKRRQLPWFLLAAQLLARNGVRVFMHGTEGHTAGRVYTREVLARLGIPVASSFERSGRASWPAKFRLLASRSYQPGAGAAHQPAPDSGAALARAHAFAHAQSVCRARHAAGHLPSRLYGDPPRGGAAAWPASYGGFPRRRRRDRAASRTSLARC